MGTPGFCALAAARAAATLAAAADGLTAAVEEVTLLAVDDVGLVVSELLDLLIPELDLDDVDAGFDGAGVLVTPVADDGLLASALLVVADEAFDTPWSGPSTGSRALERFGSSWRLQSKSFHWKGIS